MDALLSGLTEQQRHAVVTPASQLRILAGAGSGKTRVLTRRIAHQAETNGLEPNHTLALTFTRKAAGELRKRLRRLGLGDAVGAGTFHAQAYAQLRSRWADKGIRPPELLDRRGKVLFRVMPRSLSQGDRLGIASEIDWATARRISPDEYPGAAEAAGRVPPVLPAQIVEHYRAFREEKAKRRLVDFDDLLELCIRDLADPDYAATRHWRFKHLFVDEFQDVNPLQFALLHSWLGPASTLCVVGDPNQAIYGWNGADAVYLNSFERYFPSAETVTLNDNFRSTPQILAAAEAIRGEPGRLTPHRPDGPLPTVSRCQDEFGEARAVARRVRDNHTPGKPWRRQAVLVRTNAQTTLIAEALRQANVPVAIKAGASMLDEPHIADRLRELANRPAPLGTAITDLRADASAEDDDQVRDSLNMLATLADDQLALHPNATSVDFVAWARATIAADDNPVGSDAVDIVTFHAAKGLEWPIVHLAGIEEGLTPLGRAKTPEAAEEEVRLFYVAITRAEEQLHCTWAATRRFGQRSYQRNPSPFLERLKSTSGQDTMDAVPGHNATRVRALRATLGVEHSDDSTVALEERIKAWRLRVARASGVPAHVVFPDSTLETLAATRPTTQDALGALPGLGPMKLAKYGDSLLELLATDPSEPARGRPEPQQQPR